MRDPADVERLITTIRDAVIGEDTAVPGPFGPRRVTYADYTASGRSLAFIEELITRTVLPLYANTHTESSGTGLQTTRFREEARAIVRSCVGADDRHAVIFTGSGSTGAIDLLIRVLGLRIPADLDARHGLSAHIPDDQRPVVLIGPYEHHSNEVSWRETIADVVTIGEDLDGGIDLAGLEAALVAHADRPLRIGSFSAASNVTGITSDVRAVTEVLHAHGALACWDYAAAGPHVAIDVAGDDLDAVFLSPHKFIGGPGTPGVLVARRSLFTNPVPSVPGGGTVAYVNPSEHRYLADPEHREEGGTPAIIESIRAGLVFQLKAAVGVEEIRRREDAFIRRAIRRWEAHPNLEILGDTRRERLSIVSFVVRHPSAAGGPPRYLHHNFVVALLNDLFGIQARGGCSCAGPYGHRLLGIDLERSHAFEREIAGGCEGIKPGWVRVNFNYFIAEATVEFILDAVELVAEQGWRLLPRYAFEPATGLWRHVDGVATPPLSLHDVSYEAGRPRFPTPHLMHDASAYDRYLEQARALLAAEPGPCPLPPPATSPDFEALRWFPLPQEIS